MDPVTKKLKAQRPAGPFGRWYLERNGDHVQIQNAWAEYWYISFSFDFPPFEFKGATRYKKPLIFEMCFVPCDKKAWWNLNRNSSSASNNKN